MIRVEMHAVVWMHSVPLEAELPYASVLTTSPMVTHWWSAPQRKVSLIFFSTSLVVIAPFIAPQKANAEQTLTVLPANLAIKANV